MRKRLLGLDLLANKIKKSKVKKRFSIQGCLENFNNGRTFAARKMQASATSKRLWRLKESREEEVEEDLRRGQRLPVHAKGLLRQFLTAKR